jgi:hypothetical protein
LATASPKRTSPLLRGSERLEDRQEIAEIFVGGFPDEPEIDSFVMVDQLVPHPHDVGPGKLGVLISKGGGKAFGCLAEDQELEEDGRLGLRSMAKSSKS